VANSVDSTIRPSIHPITGDVLPYVLNPHNTLTPPAGRNLLLRGDPSLRAAFISTANSDTPAHWDCHQFAPDDSSCTSLAARGILPANGRNKAKQFDYPTPAGKSFFLTDSIVALVPEPCEVPCKVR